MTSRSTADSDSVAGSTSSSRSRDSSSAVRAPESLATSPLDTCSCAANATSRSCYACVNTALLSGDQCAIAPNGDCVAAAEANALYESQANSSILDSYSSSSTDHSYCEQDDSVCSKCRAIWDQELSRGLPANSSAASPRVCVGRGDCVCLAVCEAYHVANVTCSVTPAPVSSPAQVDASDGSQPFTGYAWLFVFLALFVLMSVWSYRQTHVDENGFIRTSYRQLFRGRKKRQVPVAQQLPLSGWRQYRERLIQEERAAMVDGKPARKNTLTQNGPDLTVQPGEGYRPVSPGHVSRQQQHLVAIFGM